MRISRGCTGGVTLIGADFGGIGAGAGAFICDVSVPTVSAGADTAGGSTDMSSGVLGAMGRSALGLGALFCGGGGALLDRRLRMIPIKPSANATLSTIDSGSNGVSGWRWAQCTHVSQS